MSVLWYNIIVPPPRKLLGVVVVIGVFDVCGTHIVLYVTITCAILTIILLTTTTVVVYAYLHTLPAHNIHFHQIPDRFSPRSRRQDARIAPRHAHRNHKRVVYYTHTHAHMRTQSRISASVCVDEEFLKIYLFLYYYFIRIMRFMGMRYLLRPFDVYSGRRVYNFLVIIPLRTEINRPQYTHTRTWNIHTNTQTIFRFSVRFVCIIWACRETTIFHGVNISAGIVCVHFTHIRLINSIDYYSYKWSIEYYVIHTGKTARFIMHYDNNNIIIILVKMLQ